MDRYDRLEKLGEGSYGAIYRVEERATHTQYAMKVFKRIYGSSGMDRSTMRELYALRVLTHPCIVQMRECFRHGEVFVITMELMAMNMRRYIQRLWQGGVYRRPGPDHLLFQTFQILCGLAAVHTKRLMHRDIKPENILIDRQGWVKLCDFGLTCEVSIASVASGTADVHTREVQAPIYRAPELLVLYRAGVAHASYGAAIDIWSAGLCFCDLIRGTPLFEGDSDLAMLDQVLRLLGTPALELYRGCPQHVGTGLRGALPDGVDGRLIDLIGRMLDLNPQTRITVLAALRHPYFGGIAGKVRRELTYPEWLCDGKEHRE